MGVLNHEQIYSTKFINAEITDSSDRIHVVPMKYVLGDYFITKIDGITYAFRIRGKIYTYHARAMRTVRKMYYNTKHYMPISQEDYKEMEKVIDINKLPKMDRTLFDTLRYFGKTERSDFKEHDFESIFKTLAVQKKTNKYQKETQNMIDYLKHLNINKIVTPLKDITEFFHGDMNTSDPQFFGSVLPAYQRLDHEDKKITNTPSRGKGPWLKIIALLTIAGAVIGLIAFLASSGGFDSLGSGFGNLVPQPNKPTQTSLMQQYPTPESMKIAIDNGQLDYKTLPAEMKKLIDNFKPQPIVKPKSQTVELTP